MMNSDENVVYSVSEDYIAKNPIVAFVQRRMQLKSEYAFELDGQLLPRTGKLIVEPLVDGINDGYEWAWRSEPEPDAPDLREHVEKLRAWIGGVATDKRAGHKIGWKPIANGDAEPGRAVFLLADVANSFYPNLAGGFLNSFRRAGIPMLHMNGFNVGPTWGRLEVSVDWEGMLGPELIFDWTAIDEDDDNHPGPGSTYAGELAMNALYDYSEKLNGKRGIPYKFTTRGVEKDYQHDEDDNDDDDL